VQYDGAIRADDSSIVVSREAGAEAEPAWQVERSAPTLRA
jgi:hypothetical protein